MEHSIENKIMLYITNALDVINSTLPNKLCISQGRDCVLYGDGTMDSISLVMFITLLEQYLEDH
ncbi:MAG: hypothetical protein ACK4PR_02775, partial [Gammaproteobacteria bacterium]